jgi:hypothetical protein
VYCSVNTVVLMWFFLTLSSVIIGKKRAPVERRTRLWDKPGEGSNGTALGGVFDKPCSFKCWHNDHGLLPLF